jgi:hypothetical protein
LENYNYFLIKSLIKSTGSSKFVRGVKLTEGVKHDQEKPVLALIPPDAIEEEGQVWTFGGKKYGYWNWTKGLVYTRIISAMFRHMIAIMRGEDVDSESGLLHAAHIRCCAGMLITFHKQNRTDLDDRNK